MELFAIIGIALMGTAICLLLRQYKPEYSMLVALACGVLLFFMTIKGLTPAFEEMASLMQRANINSTYTKAIVKTLGVCYITQLASDSCRDAGQTALGGKVELAGKIFIVIISLPMFRELADTAFRLMGIG